MTEPVLPFSKLPAVTPGAGHNFLGDVTVLDLTTSVAGPYCTMMLADMGATVIKIERRGSGDDSRHWGPPFLDGHALWFLSVNRNKHSMTLDFTTVAGARILQGLVAEADVLVCNHTPRVQRKLGITSDVLAAVNPQLVHTSITGFGLTGPRADWTCYDLIAEGYSGVMDLTGELENEPQKVGTPAADMLAGMDAAYATLAALYARKSTGKGMAVDISMVESMSRFMAPRVVSWLGSGELPRRSGGRDSVIAIYQVFHASDAPLTLGLGNDNLWKRFWAALGEPEQAEQAKTRSNADRRMHRQEIVDAIAQRLATRTRDEWLALFAEHRIPAGPINRLDELTADESLLERGLFYRISMNPGDAGLPQIGTGIRFDDAHESLRRPPPELGADTDQVLGHMLGLSETEIKTLREDGVV